MIVDERLLGVRDRTFDGLQLLSELNARTSFFDHRHDAAQVSTSAVQSLDNRGMRIVLMISHAKIAPVTVLPYPPGGDTASAIPIPLGRMIRREVV